MIKLLLLFCLLSSLCACAQNDVLVLEKNGANLKSYAAGVEITMETIYHQWFTGTIEALRHDTVFVNGVGFHYKEIAAIRMERRGNYKSNGTLLMAAGGGVLLLGAVNGIYRGDKAKDWYKPASFITAGSLLVLGVLLRFAQQKNYVIGRKFSLQYLALSVDKK